MTRLHVYARLLSCKALGWGCVAEAACIVALWAFRRAREAEACAELVGGRADAQV